MPHRKQGLDSWAIILFLNISEIQHFFEEARKAWIKKIKVIQENLPNSAFELIDRYKLTSDFLETLIAKYDIRNWSTDNHPEYREIWRYRPPTQKIIKQEKSFSTYHPQLLLMSFYGKCSKALEQNEPLAQDELIPFWNDLQNIAQSLHFKSNSTYNVISPEAAICAGSGVLLKLHRAWLRQEPEKEEWCVAQIVSTILSLDTYEHSDYPESPVSLSSEGFCATVLPSLWVECPDVAIFRECMIRLT